MRLMDILLTSQIYSSIEYTYTRFTLIHKKSFSMAGEQNESAFICDRKQGSR